MEAFRTAGPTAKDLEKLRALRRTKAVAAGALIGCVAVFVAARLGQAHWPWLGFVAAFAEAATIGGLADWYAVVALFRRPMGLPIPHTAIIPENRHRIADNLGGFIETNFLAPAAVRGKLSEVDFAAQVAAWLSTPARSAALADFVVQRAPQVLAAIDDTGLKAFAAKRIAEQIEKVPMAPLAAGLLSSLTAGRRHQSLLDEIIGALGALFNDEKTLSAMRERIRAELPSLFNLFRADAYLLNRIVASAGAFLEDVRADRTHPMRDEFDRFVASFVERLRDDPDYADRLNQMKRDLLARPEVATLADSVWQGLRTLVERDLAAPKSVVRRHLATVFVEIGRHLATDAQVRADMNAGFVDALCVFLENQKGGVSSFIAEQVKRWDLTQLTRIIELNIGRDLQYIRFNGMIVGGIAGLVLHTFEVAVLAN
ncbi:MAG: DUF445 family protein [Rhizobiaceae bacterium]|nr:DUF445 family protein [Rhizobiaceae bacterium]